MRTVRIILTIVGLLAIAMGVLWIAQGTGAFPYPAESFMIDQRPWVLRGAILAIVGLGATLFARRL